MRKNLLITNQMLATNNFFNLEPARKKSHALFLTKSLEAQKAATTWNSIAAKKPRSFNNYEDWFFNATNQAKSTDYEG